MTAQTQRPYQELYQTLIAQAFMEGQNATIMCAPTGSGKTVTFSDIVRKALLKGRRAMILCNRVELIEQAEDKLNNANLFPVVIDPNYQGKVSNLYVASVQTLRNRRPPEIDLLIIDECHIRAFDPIVLYYKSKGVYIIGCTATPIRKGKRIFDKKKLEKLKFTLDEDVVNKYTGQLIEVYDSIIETITTQELIQNEWLAPAVHFGPEFDREQLEKDGTGEEFSKKSLKKAFNKSKMYADAIGKYKEICNGAKAICFNIDVEHSKLMTSEFIKAGISARHVDGTMPKKERRDIFRDFHNGKFLVLNNCDVATTGYDEPTIECVIINRATDSLSLFLQMCGRGSRPCFEINKNYFFIIDMGSNVRTHGRWHDERVWTLDRRRIKKTLGAAPIKDCENCGALIPLQATTCDYCNALQKKKEKSYLTIPLSAANHAKSSLSEADFVILDELPKELKKPLHEMCVTELERYRELKGYKLGWVTRQLITRGEVALREYATLKNYQPNWVSRQLYVLESEKVATKEKIWEFIKMNPEIDADTLRNFAEKRLKANHTPEQIDLLIPKILSAANAIRK